MRALVASLQEVSGGRWVTINGRPVFIADSDAELERLKPPPVAPDKHKRVVTFKDKDGMERQRTEYDDEWNEIASKYKFAKLSRIEAQRAEIESALSKDIEDGFNEDGSLSYSGALAAVALCVVKTGMRPGSPGQGTKVKSGPDKGKFQNTYGASTIERRHVRVLGDTVSFEYLGKSGVQRKVKVKDATLARAVSALRKGKQSEPLFQSDGRRVTASALGSRLKEFNSHYKTKDFRTAVANRVAADHAVRALKKPKSIPKDKKKARAFAKRLVSELSRAVSSELGNTPAVALRSYISPPLVERFLEDYGVDTSLLESAQEKTFRPSSLSLLNILYGDEAVREWSSSFLSDAESEEDRESQHW